VLSDIPSQLAHTIEQRLLCAGICVRSRGQQILTSVTEDHYFDERGNVIVFHQPSSLDPHAPDNFLSIVRLRYSFRLSRRASLHVAKHAGRCSLPTQAGVQGTT
jgi:hypothetical protein